MSIADRWLLPDGVEDVLPPEARQLEHIRRQLLDIFQTWGYDYVIPPMVEFLESLLTGTGEDLDLKTLKVVDLLSGRTMGLRADITPQVARIDAHSLKLNGAARLCYAGTVVEAMPDTMLASRTPLSVGAELFGESSTKADIEIVSLMLDSLKSLGLTALHVDLGDVSIFRELMQALKASDEQRETLFALVQRKDVAGLGKQAQALGISAKDADRLCRLPGLCGDVSVLDEAAQVFAGYTGIVAAIDNLRLVADALEARFPGIERYFDLSELRGYGYHTGIVFAAYMPGKVVAKGGRYDDIGEVFGRPGRGATGFSINVRSLADEISLPPPHKGRVGIGKVDKKMAAGLWDEVQRLRGSGYIVVDDVVGSSGADCDYLLNGSKGDWTLTETS
ncbi:MAG: ATP phosphoribosyltransferase regulatory subunit [Pseudomonadales bacterium]